MIHVDFKFKRLRGFKEDIPLVTSICKEVNIHLASFIPPSSYSILRKNTIKNNIVFSLLN